MTSTAPDTNTTAALDWSPPCRSNYHPERGEGCAAWAVWTRACCPERSDYGLMCDACLHYALHSLGAARCRACGHRVERIRHLITRMERIRP